MELNITTKRAIVCGASRGLGFGCAVNLAREGAQLALVARRAEPLQLAADQIQSITGYRPSVIEADVACEDGRARILDGFSSPDILITNGEGPPAGDFRDWGTEEWSAALNANMVSPILLIKNVIDGMISRKFGRIINITSGAVKAPIATLGLSNGARAGFTGFIAGLARQTIAYNVTINNLLPGAFDTDRLVQTTRAVAAKNRISESEARRLRLQSIPAARFGEPDEFGALCTFLCSEQAGYITGQNILIDGGAYPGTF